MRICICICDFELAILNVKIHCFDNYRSCYQNKLKLSYFLNKQNNYIKKFFLIKDGFKSCHENKGKIIDGYKATTNIVL